MKVDRQDALRNGQAASRRMQAPGTAFRSVTAGSRLHPGRHIPGDHTRNGLLALFSFFAARFSNKVLAGFFLLSFFLSNPLLMCHSSSLRQRGAASSTYGPEPRLPGTLCSIARRGGGRLGMNVYILQAPELAS